eukprot:403364824
MNKSLQIDNIVSPSYLNSHEAFSTTAGPESKCNNPDQPLMSQQSLRTNQGTFQQAFQSVSSFVKSLHVPHQSKTSKYDRNQNGQLFKTQQIKHESVSNFNNDGNQYQNTETAVKSDKKQFFRKTPTDDHEFSMHKTRNQPLLQQRQLRDWNAEDFNTESNIDTRLTTYNQSSQRSNDFKSTIISGSNFQMFNSLVLKPKIEKASHRPLIKLVKKHQLNKLENKKKQTVQEKDLCENSDSCPPSINLTDDYVSMNQIKLNLNQEVEEIEKLRIRLDQSYEVLPLKQIVQPYNFLEKFKKSINIFVKGIQANKFHYSRQQEDKCTINLSPSLKYFQWIYHFKQVGMRQKDKIGRCDISSIRGIVYGPLTSTFLKYRQRILKEIDNPNVRPPFYGWQCVSILVDDRTLDFCIPNEERVMDFIFAISMLIEYNRYLKSLKKPQELIVGFDQIQTHRQSTFQNESPFSQLQYNQFASSIYKLTSMNLPESPSIKSNSFKKTQSLKVKYLLNDQQEAQDMNKSGGYKLIRIKMKISFEACRKAMSVQELFLTSILKVYKKMIQKQALNSDNFNSNEYQDSCTITQKHESQNDYIKGELVIKDKDRFSQGFLEQDKQKNSNSRKIQNQMNKITSVHKLGNFKGVLVRQNAEIDLKPFSIESSFDDEIFFQDHFHNHSDAKKALSTLKTIVVLKSLKVAKGIHKLKIIQRKQKLNKGNFISALQLKGFAKIPDEFKVSNLPIAYHFYDPVPKMIEKHSSSTKILRLNQIKHQGKDSQQYSSRRGVMNQEVQESQFGQGQFANTNRKRNILRTLFCCISKNKIKGHYFNQGIEKQMNYLVKQPFPMSKRQMNRSKSSELRIAEANKKFSNERQNENTKSKQSYLDELDSMKPAAQIGQEEICNKQLFVRQLMNLKVKGRFIEETQQFASEMGQKPSFLSQRKMLRGLSYQNEDQYDDFCKLMKNQKSLTRKQHTLNNAIKQESFYYNPIYQDLLRKKNHIIANTESARKNFIEKGKQLDQNLYIIKEFKPSVSYRKKRKEQRFRGLWKIAQ